MAVFKFVISDPKSRKSLQMEVEQDKAVGLIGKKIGDKFDGDIIGLTGYVLMITGGTDKDGFPMHPSLKGQGKKKIILTGPPGFHPKRDGQRKRKMVRGNAISEDITQVNIKIVSVGEGAKPFEQLIPKKEKEEKLAEKPKEAPKEAPKKEGAKPEKTDKIEKGQKPEEKAEQTKQKEKSGGGEGNREKN